MTQISKCPESARYICIVENKPRDPEAALHAPRQNHLLAALPLADYQRVLPHLEPVALPLGWTLHGSGDREPHLHFPTSGIVSRIYVTESGASAEFALTGNEGVIGVASFLGGESTLSQAVVLSPGHAYRLHANALEHERRRDGRLPRLLLRYTRALMVQTGQIAACNRYHSVGQQLCRWLLLSMDRLPTRELAITQELIASSLGVRRESVTVAAASLQKAGAIGYHRGHITVLDRPRLEAMSCECYQVVKREYDRLSLWSGDETARNRECTPSRKSLAPAGNVETA